MILSMTGFGKASIRYENTIYTVELRSLNSKSTDIRVKIPSGLADKEMFVRKIVTDGAIRGRIEVNISVDGDDVSLDQKLNINTIKAYHRQLSSIKEDLGIKESDIFSAILQIPGVLTDNTTEISEEEWASVETAITKALAEMKDFRKAEGQVLSNELKARVESIEVLLPKVQPFEEARIVKQKEKLRRNLEDFLLSDKIDENRFEQEIVYYLEKGDITEEKIRLSQHCQYFKEQLMNDNDQVGKILSFISQEMGREINTLGSKAQDFDIQQIVVMMKDELEKIKEQLANIL